MGVANIDMEIIKKNASVIYLALAKNVYVTEVFQFRLIANS